MSENNLLLLTHSNSFITFSGKMSKEIFPVIFSLICWSNFEGQFILNCKTLEVCLL